MSTRWAPAAGRRPTSPARRRWSRRCASAASTLEQHLSSTCWRRGAAARRAVGRATVCDFATVTLGLMRLQQHACATSRPRFAGVGAAAATGTPRACCWPAAGRTAQLRPATCWPTSSAAPAGTSGAAPLRRPADLAALVRRECFDVVGISAALRGPAGRGRDRIRAVRRASRNRGVGVMVGGPIFVAHPGLRRAGRRRCDRGGCAQQAHAAGGTACCDLMAQRD